MVERVGFGKRYHGLVIISESSVLVFCLLKYLYSASVWIRPPLALYNCKIIYELSVCFGQFIMNLTLG